LLISFILGSIPLSTLYTKTRDRPGCIPKPLSLSGFKHWDGADNSTAPNAADPHVNDHDEKKVFEEMHRR
jgi:hypothetical protein